MFLDVCNILSGFNLLFVVISYFLIHLYSYLNSQVCIFSNGNPQIVKTSGRTQPESTSACDCVSCRRWPRGGLLDTPHSVCGFLWLCVLKHHETEKQELYMAGREGIFKNFTLLSHCFSSFCQGKSWLCITEGEKRKFVVPFFPSVITQMTWDL